MEDIDFINNNAYLQIADKFEDASSKFYKTVMSFVEKHKPTGKRILDIGSGPGSFALQLKDKGFDVLCLDSSDEMVKRCTKKGLKVVLSRFQDFQSNEKFPIVLALSSLLHVKKSEFQSMLEKIHGILEPEGIFMLSLAQGDGEFVVSEAIPRFFAFYSKDDVLSSTNRLFKLLDYNEDYVSSNKRRFMIFAFKKV